MKRNKSINLQKVSSIIFIIFVVIGFIFGMVYGFNTPLPVQSASLLLASTVFYGLCGIVAGFIAFGALILVGCVIYALAGFTYIIVN